MCGASFFHDQCGAILIGRSFYFCHDVCTSKLTEKVLGRKGTKIVLNQSNRCCSELNACELSH